MLFRDRKKGINLDSLVDRKITLEYDEQGQLIRMIEGYGEDGFYAKHKEYPAYVRAHEVQFLNLETLRKK